MRWIQYFKATFAVGLIVYALGSCVAKDDWETPPIKCNNKFGAPNISLADFKAMAPATGYILITDELIFDAYVISSDENGNFFKTISFQDKAENATAGMQMEVNQPNNYADFPVGSHIRIKAKGLRLGLDRGTVKLGSVDEKFAVGRIPGVLFPNYISGVCSGKGMEIVRIKPKVLASLAVALRDETLINTLVTVPKVQFAIVFLNEDQSPQSILIFLLKYP